MEQNYLLSDCIISPLAFGTLKNLDAVRKGETALKLHKNRSFSQDEYVAGQINDKKIDALFSDLGDPKKYTRLEKIMILAVNDVLKKNPDLDLSSTGLVISTTKGNIDLLTTEHSFNTDRLQLWKLGEIIQQFFKFRKTPIIISNACVSGGLAIKVANDLIVQNQFKNVLIAAGDLLSPFVLAGFKSFNALSPYPCKPFSQDRNGISLGEAVAAILIGPKPKNDQDFVKYITANTANDANHISGPSRTGEGLFQAIEQVLLESKVDPEAIDYISAHGTATVYNDEMEAIAFNRLSMNAIPLNSFKAYYGHTLGASALIETILTKHCMLNNELLPSLNFEKLGTSKPINVIQKYEKANLDYALKTASGFGGCNLAMLLKKEINV